MIGRERLVCRFHFSFEKEKEGVFTGFPSFTLRKIKIKKRECEKKCECFLTGKGPKPGSRKFSFTKSKGIGTEVPRG